MSAKIIQPVVFLTFILASFMVGHAQPVTRDVCESYIKTYCLRCHTVQRICDGIGVKSEAQWQATVKMMAEYGNLDKDVQSKILQCMSSEEARSLKLCVGTTASSSASAAGQTTAEKKEKIFRSITPQEALRMLQARDDVIFLDVRTPKERAQGAIPGSKLVPLYPLLKGQLNLPKDKAILLVCAVGGRSYVAAQVLSKSGYREVYNLSGGVNGWYKAGLPLTHDSAATAK